MIFVLVRALSMIDNKNILLRMLDSKQLAVLSLFKDNITITSGDISTLFALSNITSKRLCKGWTESGFLESARILSGHKQYKLAQEYKILLGDTVI